MDIPKVRLGRTELYVTKTSFGALPVQRIGHEAARKLLRRAYESGINYFDTANMYTDSEEKIGEALHDVRQNIVISTKSGGKDKKTVREHIELSLRRMRTDYIDLFQFHNPAELPDPEDPDGPYAAALEAKEKGYIRHIGITNHRLGVAQAAMRQHPNVVPIWGIQHEWELDQWLKLTEEDQRMTPELAAVIEKDRKELAHNFCRSCGYCLPCAAGINIPQAARMAMLLRRSPYRPYMTEQWYAEMHKIEGCLHCDACKSRCPYGLDTPNLLQEMLKDYDAFYALHHND